MKTVHQIVRRYYCVSALFEMARMGIGATSVLFMLHHNVTLSDLASIKMIQCFTMLIAEMPTGLFADAFGRKKSIVLASVCSLLSFTMYLQASGFSGFCIADIFNALAISFWSGAFDAHAIETLDQKGVPRSFLNVFFSRVASYDAVGVMVGGFVGGMLAERNEHLPFYFSIIVGLLCLGSIAILPKEVSRSRSKSPSLSLLQLISAKFQNLKASVTSIGRFCIANERIRAYILLQTAVQVMIQPILHYWQPYFHTLSNEINESTLGMIFFCYVGTQTLISYIGSIVLEVRPAMLAPIIIVESALVSIFALHMASSPSLFVAISSFLLLQGGVGHLRALLSAKFNQMLESHQRASILSFVTVVSRFGMIGSLALINAMLNWLPVSRLFVFTGVTALLMMPLLIRWMKPTARRVALMERA